MIALALLSSPSRSESVAPEVPPTIVAVVSGGVWQAGDSHGFFRVIVENQGFEHIHSVLWLEWVVAGSRDSQPRVASRVRVDELSMGNWSLGIEPATPTFSANRLLVSGTNPFTLEEQVFSVEFSAVGKYKVVRHAV